MKLSIVTPDSLVFAGTVDSVVLPGVDGQLGVLPKHACLVTMLQPGELAYRHEGNEHFLVVGDGFIEVTQENVIVLTDMALGEAEIDEKQAEDAIARAKEKLQGIDHSQDAEEVAYLQGVISKSGAALTFKRKYQR